MYDDNWLYLPTDAKFRGEFWLKKSLRDLEFEMCTCIKRGGHYHPLPRSIGGPKIPLDPDDLSPEELLKMLDFDHTLKIRIGLHDAQAYLENVISFRFYDHLISAFDGHVPPAYELVSELRQCIIPYITIAQFFGEWLDRLPGKRDFMSLETLKNKLQDSVFGYILRRDKYLTNREIDELNQDWRQRLLNACDLAIDDLIWLFALKHIRVGRRAKVQVDSEPEVPSGPVMKKREEGAKPLSSLCPVDNFSGQEDRGGKSSSEDGGPSVDNIVDDPPRGSNDKNSEKAPNKDDTEAAIKKRKRHAPSGPGEMKEEGSDVETLPPADHHFNGSHQGRGGTGNQKKTKGGDDTKVLTKKPKRKAPHPSKRKAADEEDDYFPSKAEERRAKRQRGRRA